MKSLIFGFVLLSWFNQKKEVEPQFETIRARITYYHPYQDKWGSQVACPNTKKAEKGITVAAHSDFKFGQKIIIPELAGVIGDGEFIVQDRGPAVEKKKASKNGEYVFDIYLNNGSELKKMIKNNPMYMDVQILTHE